MKKILLITGLAFTVPLLSTGCANRPVAARYQETVTLKVLGESARATVALSAQLYRDGKITAVQANVVKDFFDQKWQPAFRLAVVAVSSNLDSFASPEIMSLAAQLTALVAPYIK